MEELARQKALMGEGDATGGPQSQAETAKERARRKKMTKLAKTKTKKGRYDADGTGDADGRTEKLQELARHKRPGGAEAEFLQQYHQKKQTQKELEEMNYWGDKDEDQNPFEYDDDFELDDFLRETQKQKGTGKVDEKDQSGQEDKEKSGEQEKGTSKGGVDGNNVPPPGTRLKIRSDGKVFYTNPDGTRQELKRVIGPDGEEMYISEDGTIVGYPDGKGGVIIQTAKDGTPPVKLDIGPDDTVRYTKPDGTVEILKRIVGPDGNDIFVNEDGTIVGFPDGNGAVIIPGSKDGTGPIKLKLGPDGNVIYYKPDGTPEELERFEGPDGKEMYVNDDATLIGKPDDDGFVTIASTKHTGDDIRLGITPDDTVTYSNPDGSQEELHHYVGSDGKEIYINEDGSLVGYPDGDGGVIIFGRDDEKLAIGPDGKVIYTNPDGTTEELQRVVGPDGRVVYVNKDRTVIGNPDGKGNVTISRVKAGTDPTYGEMDEEMFQKGLEEEYDSDDEYDELPPGYARDAYGRIIRLEDGAVMPEEFAGRYSLRRRLANIFGVPRLKRNKEGRPTGGYMEDEFGPKAPSDAQRTSDGDSGETDDELARKQPRLGDDEDGTGNQREGTGGKFVGFAVPDDDELSYDPSGEGEFQRKGRREISTADREKLRQRLFRKQRRGGPGGRRGRGSGGIFPGQPVNVVGKDGKTEQGYIGADGETVVDKNGQPILGPDGQPIKQRELNPLVKVYGKPGPYGSQAPHGHMGPHAGPYGRGGPGGFLTRQDSDRVPDQERQRMIREGLASDTRFLSSIQSIIGHKNQKGRPWMPRSAFQDEHISEEQSIDGDRVHDDQEGQTREGGTRYSREDEYRMMGRGLRNEEDNRLFTVVRRPGEGGPGRHPSQGSSVQPYPFCSRYDQRNTIPWSLIQQPNRSLEASHSNLASSRSADVSRRSYDDNRLKILLEELYKDKKYFDQFIDTNTVTSDANMQSKHLANHGRDYLLEYADHWEEIIPPYSMPRPPLSDLSIQLSRINTQSMIDSGRSSIHTTVTPTTPRPHSCHIQPDSSRGQQASSLGEVRDSPPNDSDQPKNDTPPPQKDNKPPTADEQSKDVTADTNMGQNNDTSEQRAGNSETDDRGANQQHNQHGNDEREERLKHDSHPDNTGSAQRYSIPPQSNASQAETSHNSESDADLYKRQGSNLPTDKRKVDPSMQNET